MGKSAVKGLLRWMPVGTTWMLVTVTIVAPHSGHYHPNSSVVVPLPGLVIPILLVSCPITVLYWALARERWAIILLAAFFFNWEYLTAVVRFGSTGGDVPAIVPAPNREGKSGVCLTVATYNVHHFGNEIAGYSCKEIAHYMQQRHADVLCFQEFDDNPHFTMDSLCRALSHWPCALIPAGDSIRGILPVAVLSRYPPTGGRFITYPRSFNYGMACDIVLGVDTLRLLNNHLQTTSVSQDRREWEREPAANDTRHETQAVQDAAETLHKNFVKRAAQTDSTVRLVVASPHPVLMCGNFNSLPLFYTYRQLSGILQDGLKTGGHGYMYTYRYAKHMLRIDYAFHSSKLDYTDCYSPDLDLCSDHSPVIFTVKY